MKAFLKTYWLEAFLFAIALLGDLIVLPFLPEQVPVYWNIPFCQAPKWTLLLLTVTQLPGACLVRFGLHLYFAKYPAVALTFGSLERLVPPAFFSGADSLPAQFSSGVLWPILSCAVCPFSGAGVSGPSLYWPCRIQA